MTSIMGIMGKTGPTYIFLGEIKNPPKIHKKLDETPLKI